MKNKFIGFVKENKFALLLIFMAFGLIALLTNPSMLDYDYWFHYRAGEYFATTGKVPQNTLNSWYGQLKDIYWVSHEWIFGVLIYWVTNVIGQYGVAFFPTAMIALICALVILYKRDFIKSGNSFLFIVAVILLVKNLVIGDTPRPHLFAYLFTFLLYVILEKDNQGSKYAAYFLIPLNIAWVNFHGGSYILLFVFLFAHILLGCFEFKLGKIVFEKKELKDLYKLLFILLGCAVTIPLNGHGFDMVLYPFTNFADELMQTAITEWNSPDIKETWQIFCYLPILLCTCAFISTKKEIKAFDLVTYGAYCYLFFRSIRFAPQTTIVMILIMCKYADVLEGIDEYVRSSFRVMVLSVLAAMFIVVGAPNIIDRAKEPFIMDVFPSDALVETIKEEGAERLFNEYNIGGYLLYKHVDVFIDGRADIYSPYNFADYLKIVRGNYGLPDLIEEYDFDYFLVSKESVIQRYILSNLEQYGLVDEDENFALYLRY